MGSGEVLCTSVGSVRVLNLVSAIVKSQLIMFQIERKGK